MDLWYSPLQNTKVDSLSPTFSTKNNEKRKYASQKLRPSGFWDIARIRRPSLVLLPLHVFPGRPLCIDSALFTCISARKRLGGWNRQLGVIGFHLCCKIRHASSAQCDYEQVPTWPVLLVSDRSSQPERTSVSLSVVYDHHIFGLVKGFCRIVNQLLTLCRVTDSRALSISQQWKKWDGVIV